MKDNNFNNNIVKKDNDTKKIFVVLVLLMTLMVCITGATYAYFAISATSVNNITGTSATASLIITNESTATQSAIPSYVAPTDASNQSLPMVPQISYTGSTNVLQKALTGATEKDKCVDGNGNVICKAFTFYVRNLSTAAVDVRGSLKFTYSNSHATDPFPNLRWKLMTDENTVSVSTSTVSNVFSATAPIKASTSKVYFDTSNVALAANGGTKQYWVIIWIEETLGADQSAKDKGTWYGTIEFEAFNETGTSIGGVTSTITG